MYDYKNMDVTFRDEQVPVTVMMHGKNAEDWYFTDLDTHAHDALQMTQDEQDQISQQIQDELDWNF